MINDVGAIGNLLGICPLDNNGKPLVYLDSMKTNLEDHPIYLYRVKVVPYNRDGIRTTQLDSVVENFNTDHTFNLYPNLHRQVPTPYTVIVITTPDGSPHSKKDVILKKISHGFYLNYGRMTDLTKKPPHNSILITKRIENYLAISAFVFNSQSYFVLSTTSGVCLFRAPKPYLSTYSELITFGTTDNVPDIFITQWNTLSRSNQEKLLMNFSYYHQTIIGSLVESSIQWISIMRNRGACSSDTTLTGYLTRSLDTLKKIGLTTIEFQQVAKKTDLQDKSGSMAFYLKDEVTTMIRYL